MDKVLKSLIDMLEFEKRNGMSGLQITETLSIESSDSIHTDLKRCTECRLHKTCIQKVMGSGCALKGLMIIGEAPGAEEDMEGVPFVGRAGKKLNQIMGYIGLTRDDVYITNVVKCRPPQNADPDEEMISKCSVFLEREMKMAAPKIILTLGRFAARVVTGESDRRMSFYLNKDFTYKGIPVITTYHPSALLQAKGERQEEMRQQIGKDMRKLKKMMENNDGYQG